MNLGKLFNFKYLMQNIKKSKGLLTVLVLIIPVITTLVLIGNNSSEYASATSEYMVTVANILGMYIIPVVISYILYGYVYKKNSVDFIGAMPLTRSTVFTTNFIGGLIIILAVQVLTAITTAVSALVLSNIFITGAMILDIFVVMFLAYSFVFAAAAIAMTVSGNFLTQIVVTLLIVFLIPFVFGFTFIATEKTLDIELANRIVTITEEKNDNFTLPSTLVLELVRGNGDFYTVQRNVKTFVIVIAYFGIGLYLFNKRKMENVGASFSKLWVHLVVKAITLVPMVFVLEMLELDGIFFWIAVVLIFIYYCLYDFITNRKVHIKYTVPCFIVSFVALIGAYKAVQFCGEKVLHNTISLEDIKGISVENTNYSGISSFYMENYRSGIDFYIEDEEFVKTVCEAIHGSENPNYWSSNDWSMVSLNLKLKNGSKKHTTAVVKYNVVQDAIKKMRDNQEYMEKYAEDYKIPENSYIIADYKFLSKEDTKEIVNIFNQIDINRKIEIEDEFSSGGYVRNYVPQPNFCVFYYKNHDLQQIELNPFLSQEMFDKINEVSKRLLLEKFNNYEGEKHIYSYISEKRVNTKSEELEDSINFERTDNLIKYIKERANEKFDMTDKFYVINIDGSNIHNNTIFLKETDELDYIIKQDKAYHIYYEEGEYPDNYYDDLEVEDTILYQ